MNGVHFFSIKGKINFSNILKWSQRMNLKKKNEIEAPPPPPSPPPYSLFVRLCVREFYLKMKNKTIRKRGKK